MRNLKFRTSGLIFIVSLALSGAILLTSGFVIVNKISDVSAEWDAFQHERSEQARLRSVLRSALGYGGMIHEFKDFVLRQDMPRMDKVQEHLGAAFSTIKQYRALGVSQAEHAALKDIEDTIENYADALLVAQRLIAEGKSPREIDEIVRVDDTLALRGLNNLGESDATHLEDHSPTFEKAHAVDALRSELGYGGMVHQFKNYVLRHEPEQAEQVRARLAGAEEIIARYRALGVNKAEGLALEDIRNTLRHYREGLDLATDLIGQGQSPQAIDQAVNVHDRLSLWGFAILDREVAAQIEERSLEVTNALRLVERLAATSLWTSSGLVVFLTSMSLWLIFTRVVRPINRMTDIMNRLAAGDLEQEIDGTDLDNEMGQMARSLAFFKDNLVKRKAEEGLRRSEERLSAIMSHAADGIITADERGSIESVNAAAAEIFGYEVAEITGRPITMLMNDHDARHHDLYVRNYLNTGESEILGKGPHEVVARRKNGEEFPLQLAISEVFLGEDHYFIGTMSDVSRQKMLEEQLRQTQKMKAVGHLTGGVAHEFNNLLMAITGNLELIEEEVRGQERLRKRVDTAIRAAFRGKELTTALLAYSRKTPLSPELTDIGRVVLRYTETFGQTLGEAIRVETRIAENVWPAVVDTGELEATLLNLAINARDAMPEGGAITMAVENVRLDRERADKIPDLDAGAYVVISIEDTGSGMAPEVLEQAFEPFFTTKDVGMGTGLGLSMVYGFAKQSGGHVEIESGEGRGTTVKLYLPKAEGVVETQAIEEEPKDRETLPTGSGTILVVEDDDVVRAVAVATLERLGYEVLEASDGPTALATLEEGARIDMLFSDIVMHGGISGPELAEKARRTNPALKVLLATGYDPDEVSRAGEGGAELPTLAKPYYRHELANRVREIMGVESLDSNRRSPRSA